MIKQTRRIVTGHDQAGRSVVLSDGPPPVSRTLEAEGVSFVEIWNTNAMPAPIAAREAEPTDRPIQITPREHGSIIRINEFLPGHTTPGAAQTPMHRTETVDYGIVLEGEIYLVLDEDEVRLTAGDVVIQRGTDHAWDNRSDALARMAFILLDGAFADDVRSLLPTGALEKGTAESNAGLQS